MDAALLSYSYSYRPGNPTEAWFTFSASIFRLSKDQPEIKKTKGATIWRTTAKRDLIREERERIAQTRYSRVSQMRQAAKKQAAAGE
jgi:hypothetical protein